MAIAWTADQPNVRAAIMVAGAPLPSQLLIANLIDIYPGETDSPFPLPEFPADVAFRTDAVPDQYTADLQKIFTDIFNRSIRCDIRTEMRDTIILRGSFLYTPAQTSKPAKYPEICFYINNPMPTIASSGSGGNARNF